jgi:hypothetical protein
MESGEIDPTNSLIRRPNKLLGKGMAVEVWGRTPLEEPCVAGSV